MLTLGWEQLEDSWIVQDALQKAREQGREQAREQAREQEARRSLLLVLAARFPDLQNVPELDRITGVETLEALLVQVSTAQSADAARAAIEKAMTTA